jgi:hypothetical protein
LNFVSEGSVQATILEAAVTSHILSVAMPQLHLVMMAGLSFSRYIIILPSSLGQWVMRMNCLQDKSGLSPSYNSSH